MTKEQLNRTYHQFLYEYAKPYNTTQEHLIIIINRDANRKLRKQLRYLFLFKTPMALLSASKKHELGDMRRAFNFIIHGNI